MRVEVVIGDLMAALVSDGEAPNNGGRCPFRAAETEQWEKRLVVVDWEFGGTSESERESREEETLEKGLLLKRRREWARSGAREKNKENGGDWWWQEENK
jgi:hypothetical protein